MFAAADMLWVVMGALVLEGMIGYPPAVWRRIGHPVSWMGHGLRLGESLLSSKGKRTGRDFIFGMTWMALAIVLVGAATCFISNVLQQISYGWAIEILLMATLIASRSLYQHVDAVREAFTLGLEQAQQKVALIVGRNTEDLDEPSVSRAAVESLAENASDGVIAPLFWGLVGGLPGIAIYKLVNTADSMWGHRNDRYEWFGKSAARLDDISNLIPARLTGLLFCISAIGLGRSRSALRIMFRDASLHLSPNAGWPEAAMAGALDCRLGGPRSYEGDETDGVWLGDGSSTLNAADIRRALDLYLIALFIAAALLFVGGMIWGLMP